MFVSKLVDIHCPDAQSYILREGYWWGFSSFFFLVQELLFLSANRGVGLSRPVLMSFAIQDIFEHLHPLQRWPFEIVGFRRITFVGYWAWAMNSTFIKHFPYSFINITLGNTGYVLTISLATPLARVEHGSRVCLSGYKVPPRTLRTTTRFLTEVAFPLFRVA